MIRILCTGRCFAWLRGCERRLALMSVAALALGGCTSEGLYQGLQTREEMQRPQPRPPEAEKPMSYEQYEAEREKLKGR